MQVRVRIALSTRSLRRKVYDMPAIDGSWQNSGVMLCKSAFRVENEQEHAHED